MAPRHPRSVRNDSTVLLGRCDQFSDRVIGVYGDGGRRYRCGRKNIGAVGIRRPLSRIEAILSMVFDCTGDRGSMELLQQFGKLIFVGLINDSISLFDLDLHRREVTILASRNSTPAEHHRVLDLTREGRSTCRRGRPISFVRRQWRKVSSVAPSRGLGGEGGDRLGRQRVIFGL
jgi:hypothetical protein